MKTQFALAAFFAALVLIASCRKDEEPGVVVDPPKDSFDLQVAPYLNIGRKPLDYTVKMPAHLASMQGLQADAKKAQLGRVIFYDKKLSKDGQVACAACHQANAGFSDPNQFSKGVFGRKTPRNSMSLVSSAWFSAAVEADSVGNVVYPFFWDHRAFSVADQSRGAFTNENEMAMTMPEVLEQLRKAPFYSWLFAEAYGDTSITEARVFTSLSHFMSAMGSHQSKFDKAMQAQSQTDARPDLTGLTPEENLGKSLYFQHCESCHGSLTGRQNIFEANNGLENPYKDKGKGAISGLFYENGVFRVPGLRNIANSAPYMHDGRFATLEAVIEHYNSGVVRVFGLHGDLLVLGPNGYEAKHLNLEESQKKALKAFLLTLSDPTVAADERFGNPFK